MTPAIYDATVPALVRGLRILTVYLDKATAYAAERKFETSVLVASRLAPDMAPFSSQIQRVSDSAKGAIVRLTGAEAPAFPDTETTFDELRERIAKTIAFVESVDPSAFADSATRTIELKFGPYTQSFTGTEFVQQFLLPNVYFHISTAHAILRHNGVPIGKLDYLGATL